MASAKKGAEKWLSAITEKYTNTDHKWIHGVKAKSSYRSFVNLQRGTSSEICISTSLDKTVEVNGPFLTMSACIWPENTRTKTCKKKKKKKKNHQKKQNQTKNQNHPKQTNKKTNKQQKTTPKAPPAQAVYLCASCNVL
ncbi:unnamed protein product, partial [Bubo scandiacus]